MAIGRNLKPLVRNGKAFSPVTNLTVHLKKIAIINQLQIALFRQLNHKACQEILQNHFYKTFSLTEINRIFG